jgi:transposase
MVGPFKGEPQVEIRKFGTIRAELPALRDWLKQQEVSHVVMESTGSYWKPVFNVLEDTVKVYLANPQEVKNRKGHKTDNKDGWWLAHLLRHAMIHPSFIPPRAIRELRDLTRRRKRLLGAGTSERNRVQKVLEDANVKLGNVLSDVFGISGQLMPEALLQGQAKPAAGSSINWPTPQSGRRVPRCRSSFRVCRPVWDTTKQFGLSRIACAE